jgi:UDP-N-acetylmuramate-alanine ligase
VAAALQERGFKVTGSDENVYPPMSNFLMEKGLTTQLLERGSKYAYSLCDVCARACEELAEACDAHAEIEVFSHCGEACRKCADECAKLAKLKKTA